MKKLKFFNIWHLRIISSQNKKLIKLRLDRDDDIIITGKRHDFYSEYEVGFNDQGVIQGLKIKLASRCGCHQICYMQ